MDQQSLASLREKILADIVPLVINTSDNGGDRFGILLRIIQAGNAPRELYDKAYEAAAAIEDNDSKLEAFMALLDELDLDLTPQEEGPQEDAPVPESQPQSEAPHDDAQY